MKKIITLLFGLLLIFNCSNKNNSTLNKSNILDFETTVDSLELLFPNFISTQLYERDFALSPKRDEIIYTLSNSDQTMRVLVSIKKNNGIWGEKKVLLISGTHNDIEPFYSPDGNQLFFASNRPIYGDSLRKDYNIWVCKNEDGDWRNPEPLDSIINTKGDEFYPAVTNTGNLYFTSSKVDGIGLEDIYVSKYTDNAYQNPVALDTMINSKSYEFNAYINPEEDLLIFSSYGRPDGFGGGDLYYSTKDTEGNWTASKNFGELINSDKLDFCPFYDAKTQLLYFSSMRNTKAGTITSVEEFIKLTEQPKNGLSDIYRVSIKDIFETL